MKNKPLDVDNDFDKTSGEGGEKVSRLEFSIKDDGGILFVSVCKSDNEVKGVRWGSVNARVGWL